MNADKPAQRDLERTRSRAGREALRGEARRSDADAVRVALAALEALDRLDRLDRRPRPAAPRA